MQRTTLRLPFWNLVLGFVLTVVIPLLAVACAVTDATSPTRTPVPRAVLGVEKTPLPKTKQECEQAGGRWEQLGMIGMGCNMPTTDSGQPCENSKECQGFCLATDPETVKEDEFGNQVPDHDYIERVNHSEKELKGECAAWVSTFGYSVILEAGRYVVICVD